MKQEPVETTNASLSKQVEGWKKEYGEGNVLCVSVVVSDNDTAIGYVVKPEAKELAKHLAIYQKAFSLINQQRPIEAGQFLLNECFLGGDSRIKGTHAKVHISAALQIVELIAPLVVSVTTV